MHLVIFYPANLIVIPNCWAVDRPNLIQQRLFNMSAFRPPKSAFKLFPVKLSAAHF